MASWVKNLVFSLLWLRALLWLGVDPWPGNLHVPWAQTKKKKEENTEIKRAQLREDE